MILKYIEEKADETLRKHGFYSLPIDVLKLAEELGVNIEPANLAPDISGIFVIKNDKPYIRYSKNDIKTRVRFTIAHELGHWLLHSKSTPLFIDRTPKIMFRNIESSTGEIHKEREANSFAAALLMPEILIKKEMSKLKMGDAVEQLADIFEVSTQAMSFRLSNLGFDLGIFN